MTTIIKALRTRLPAIAAGLVLCAAIATGGIDARAPENADEYFALAAEAIGGISLRIGDWNGYDGRVSPAADELLKPNAILQRSYEDALSGRTFSLLLVHTRDARDMDGHYPPICYVNAGFRPIEQERITLQAGSAEIPATRYTYRPPDELQRPMEITNFLIVPAHASPYSADIRSVRSASRSRASAGLGSAQVQVIFDESIPGRDERDEIIGRVLEEIEPVIELIARGPSRKTQQ